MSNIFVNIRNYNGNLKYFIQLIANIYQYKVMIQFCSVVLYVLYPLKIRCCCSISLV